MGKSQHLKIKDLIPELKRIAGDNYVLDDQADLLVYEYDGSIDRGNPVVVVLPNTTKEISQVLKLARSNSIPVVARGAGTGLSGGAIAEQGGIVLSMARMNQILEVNRSDRYAIVEPGVVNLDLSTHVASEGLYYAPDPSSQRACTIGGNIAENSGGPHCLAYGVTTNHVLGMEVVLADGTITWFGENERDGIGYDLRGITIGSEGTLAIVTKISVRLLRLPEHVKTMLMSFETIEDASAAVTGIIGAGMVPAALEMMDHFCIKAAVGAGYPEGAGAVLLVELDGLLESVEEESEEIEAICREFSPLEIRVATDSLEREKLWSGRKGVLGALGRLAPNYYLVDGTIPRTKLVEVLKKINEISERSGYPIANLLHAGDGNLHPSILFDERKPGDVENILAIGAEILRICVDSGGVLSGEHGIGLEKQDQMPLMFTEEDMATMSLLKLAFETEDLLNPGKVFPTGAGCGDISQARAIARVGPGAYI
ncbi:MAG: FAD-binding protein [Dehalococcoidia bacterium]|nr:FAD-binding oxidoreductase [Candidatus Neomarinimicrobiota bacterium]MCS5650498.1 FAD-binding protein [Dehalococcoidia bacterium]HBF00702.1 FAD-binding oxidoreductase [Dehalococcoidia bacterium]